MPDLVLQDELFALKGFFWSFGPVFFLDMFLLFPFRVGMSIWCHYILEVCNLFRYVAQP